MLKMDGFDDCILGLFTRCGMDPIICYDEDKVIAKLMSQGMTRDEAYEFYEFNQASAWAGDGTPGFVDTSWRPEDD